MTVTAKEELIRDGAMTIKQAVAFSGIGRTSLYAEMDRGALPYLKNGRRRLVPVAGLKKLMTEKVVG